MKTAFIAALKTTVNKTEISKVKYDFWSTLRMFLTPDEQPNQASS